MKKWPLVATAFLAVAGGRAAAQEIELAPLIEGLDQPVVVTTGGDRTGRLFVVEQVGRIHIFQAGALLPEPFLDLSREISCCGEQIGRAHV